MRGREKEKEYKRDKVLNGVELEKKNRSTFDAANEITW